MSGDLTGADARLVAFDASESGPRNLEESKRRGAGDGCCGRPRQLAPQPTNGVSCAPYVRPGHLVAPRQKRSPPFRTSENQMQRGSEGRLWDRTFAAGLVTDEEETVFLHHRANDLTRREERAKSPAHAPLYPNQHLACPFPQRTPLFADLSRTLLYPTCRLLLRPRSRSESSEPPVRSHHIHPFSPPPRTDHLAIDCSQALSDKSSSPSLPLTRSLRSLLSEPLLGRPASSTPRRPSGSRASPSPTLSRSSSSRRALPRTDSLAAPSSSPVWITTLLARSVR